MTVAVWMVFRAQFNYRYTKSKCNFREPKTSSKNFGIIKRANFSPHSTRIPQLWQNESMDLILTRISLCKLVPLTKMYYATVKSICGSCLTLCLLCTVCVGALSSVKYRLRD